MEKKGLITTEEEFDSFEWPEIDYSRLYDARKHLPQKMKMISGSLAGIYEETWTLMGSEEFAFGLIKSRGGILLEK